MRVWIWSLRAIKAGEEITYDYGKEYFDDTSSRKGVGAPACWARVKPAHEIKVSVPSTQLHSPRRVTSFSGRKDRGLP